MIEVKVREKLGRKGCPQHYCSLNRPKYLAVLRLIKGRHYKLMARILAGCPKCQFSFYEEFRKKTGYCEICPKQIKTHVKCQACGQLLGQEHGYLPINLYGKSVCYQCLTNWGKVKQRIGTDIDIERIVFWLWLKGKLR